MFINNNGQLSSSWLLTELLECHGHVHGGGVDEGEEEHVGAELLVGVQPRLPGVVVGVEAGIYQYYGHW